ncbi:MAG: SpoIIE family protein phosphatase [Bacteroidales bacterium]|nr:SpoIIE family protein phosphatase [Bacteroidales bacterium]
MKKLFQIFFLVILTLPSFSQIKNLGEIPFINNYSPETYSGARQNWIAVQDQRGLMYFGNSDGSVLEFDGQNWNKIKVSETETSITALCVDNKNVIYVGGDNEIGYLHPTSNGSLVFKSLSDKIPDDHKDFQKIWDIFVTEDSAIFFQTFDEIFLYKNDSITVLPIENYFPEGLFLISYQVNGKIYIYTKYKGIYELANNDLKFIVESEIINNSYLRTLLNYKQDSLLIFTWFDGAYTMKDGKITPKKTPIDSIIDRNLYRAISIKDDYYAFQLNDGGILITDKEFKIIQFITSQNGLQNDKIYRATLDNQENLWLCTDNGISTVYLFSPFTTYNQFNGFENESTSFSSKLFNNILYIATTSGVYYKKWTDYENKIKKADFTQIKNPSGNIKTEFLDIVDNKLIAASANGLFDIENFTAIYFLAEGTDRAVRGVKIFRVPKEDSNTIIGLSQAIFIYKKNNGKWTLSHDIQQIYEQDIYGEYLEQDENGYFWISNKNQGVYKIKFDQYFNQITEATVFDTIHGLNGLPSQENNKIFKIDNNLYFSTKEGLYKYNPSNNNFSPYDELNDVIGTNVSVRFINKDSHGNIWYKEETTNNDEMNWELCYLKNTDSGFVKIREPFLPFKNKIFFFDQLSENTYLIGGPNGFVHYDETIENNYAIEFPAFIRSVKILNSDSIIFNGAFITKDSLVGSEQLLSQIPILEYKNGNLRFTFSGTYLQSPDKIEYKYFLEGNDQKWSEWTSENYKDYSNLKPGEYKFQVKARNQYLIESTIASYEFVIKPPWYLTILAFIGYFVLAGLLIWLIVFWYTRRLRLQKEYLEEQVKLRTQEIEQQKEEIESQRDQLAEQNEEIQKINKDITSSIEYAKRIQTAMLPLNSTIQKHLKEHFILFKPRDIVSGDFYWFSKREDKAFIAAVDCTGHGVPGAFMSMIGAEILTTIVSNKGVSDASEILELLNKYVRTALKQDTTENQDGMDMALCVIDEENKTVEFSGAKNPLFYISNEEITKIKGSRQSIGGFQFGEFERHTIKYSSPTWFYIFSDGYADQFGGDDHSKFMIKRFKDLLLEIYQKPMEEQKEILDKAVTNWMETTRQTDDILVIGFKL